MKLKGPIVTLAAGAIVAAVLLVLNTNATRAAHESAAPPNDSSYGEETSPAVTPSTPAATTPAPTPVAEAPVTYAGNVGGGGATLAIAVKDGKAIAYVCDGKSAEAWLQGTGSGGTLTLTGSDGATLSGTYANGQATGTVTATGRQWTFAIGAVSPPSGLYRANANVANAQIVGGWIVLADGRQVGTTRKGTTVTPAPTLNLTNLTAVIDNTTVSASAVDGTKLI
jgi:serine/threonine-protein kinase